MSLLDGRANGIETKIIDQPLHVLCDISMSPHIGESLTTIVTQRTKQELDSFNLTTMADLLRLSCRDLQFLNAKLSSNAFHEVNFLFLQTWDLDIEEVVQFLNSKNIADNQTTEAVRRSNHKHGLSPEKKVERKLGKKSETDLKQTSTTLGQNDFKDGKKNGGIGGRTTDLEQEELFGPHRTKLSVTSVSISDIEAASKEVLSHEFTVCEWLAKLDSLSYFPLNYLHNPTERLFPAHHYSDVFIQHGGDDGGRFYEYAMNLFQAAGHMEDAVPAFINHSAERAVYFDLPCSVGLSVWERKLLNQFGNVSELFSINQGFGGEFSAVAIKCFSIEINHVHGSPCELIGEITKLLCKASSVPGIIVLAKVNERMTFSFAGYGMSNVLSDWYPIDIDMEALIEKIHIANMSCSNSAAYFFDFIYSVGRQYYFDNLRGNPYIDIPIDYLDREGSYFAEKSEIQLLIKHLANAVVSQYGEDYLEMEIAKNDSAPSNSSVDDLDMLLLENLDSEDADVALDVEIEKEIEEEFMEEFGADANADEDENIRDAENFEHISQDIFDNPMLMIDHLKKLF